MDNLKGKLLKQGPDNRVLAVKFLDLISDFILARCGAH
tara:strand:- start:2036 stop:2149 length:114 start_codon:yes stop_codon:yes gene_type:complete